MDRGAVHRNRSSLRPALNWLGLWSRQTYGLVVLIAKDAGERGATVMTRTCCAKLRRRAGRWAATLVRADGSTLEVEARAVVNATGPWVDRFLDGATPLPARHHPRQVKGSHIVVPRLFDHEFAYIFQGADGRIVFAIPYEGDFTLIGTTEVDYTGDLSTPAITETEIDYLVAMANRYFASDLERRDVVWTFAGLRPLLADPKDRATSVTRDYVLDLDTRGAPLLSIYGGKLTTYRKLAFPALVLVFAPDTLSSRFTPQALALTHAVTLGFLAMVMLGALTQMLPVMAGSPMPAPLAVARLTHAPVALGTLALMAGFLNGLPIAFGFALILLGFSLAVFLLAAAVSLARTTAGVTVSGIRLAVACLGLTLLLGLALALLRAGWSEPTRH